MPLTLPVKFPLLLAQGVEGIAVGLACKILPHNFNELITAAIAVLRDEPFTLLPDATLPSQVSTSITSIAGFMGLVWKFFPLTFTALVGAVVIIVATENWVAIYKVVRWVYQKIPGVS